MVSGWGIGWELWLWRGLAPTKVGRYWGRRVTLLRLWCIGGMCSITNSWDVQGLVGEVLCTCHIGV